MLPRSGLIGPLLVELGLNRLEQGLLEDGGLLAREDLAFVSDLADIKTVTQEGGEAPSGERDAPDGASIGQRSEFCFDAGPP